MASDAVFACKQRSAASLLEERLVHRLGDIRDADRVASLVNEVRPQVVLHLAAQLLARRSYAEHRPPM